VTPVYLRSIGQVAAMLGAAAVQAVGVLLPARHTNAR
jgi:hypothetical protein